jgi:hypothetical protein
MTYEQVLLILLGVSFLVILVSSWIIMLYCKISFERQQKLDKNEYSDII